jgi:23S rRNA (cytosine1962-C5)-methyltransferase
MESVIKIPGEGPWKPFRVLGPGALWASTRGGAGDDPWMSVPAFKLKPNANSRVLSGHPWVFANEVEAPLPAECDGEVVEVPRPDRPAAGHRHLQRPLPDRLAAAEPRAGGPRRGLPAGRARARDWRRRAGRPGPSGAWSGRSRTTSRRRGRPVRRHPGGADPDARDGEALGPDRRPARTACSAPAEVIFRNDAPIRRLEGLPIETHTRSGRPWEPRWAAIDGFEYWLDLMGGQKTGFYLDQRRSTRGRHVRYCAGAPRVLDAFCNQGSFALHAAKAGPEVLGLDSAEAHRGGPRNAERTGSRRRSRSPTSSTG